MNRLFTRFWNAWISRLDRRPEKEGHPTPPAELEALRKNAAALTALASQTRLEIAGTLQQHDRLDEQIKAHLLDGNESEARPLLTQIESLKARLDALLHQYEAQRHAAEGAVQLFHHRESAWRETHDALKSARRMERAASLADVSSYPGGALPKGQIHVQGTATSDRALNPQNPVAAARDLLSHPVSASERTLP
jgi:chromosome segregation ATPase